MTKAFLFVVTVPRASYENQLLNESKNSKTYLNSHEEGNVSFGVESEVPPPTKSDLKGVKNCLRVGNDLKYLSKKFGLAAVDVNKTKENGDKVVRDGVSADGKFLLFSQEYKNGGNERNGDDGKDMRLTKKSWRSLKEYIAGLKQDPQLEGGFTPPRRQKLDSDVGGKNKMDLDADEINDDLPMEKVWNIKVVLNVTRAIDYVSSLFKRYSLSLGSC